MAEYIEREVAYCEFCADETMSGYEKAYCCEIIKTIPAADVAPVRHGQWIMTAYTTVSKRNRIISNKKFSCSECAYTNGRKKSNYCQNCGAKMDLEV